LSDVLDIADLRVQFAGRIDAVRGLSLRVARGEMHCLVGESGSGKSAAALAIMNLLPRSAFWRAAHVRILGEDISMWSERQFAALRGDRLAMIFQEPMSSLNPALTVGAQLTEVLRRHTGLTRAASRNWSMEMLSRVGVSAPDLRMRQFPHVLSGGLRQRVMIAMALLCGPNLLIADEPTTSLDVTVQAHILRLLVGLKRDMGLGILLITHDLGLVARVADTVSVMYGGEIVETAPTAELFANPMHPYTRGLLGCVPVPGRGKRIRPLGSIRGTVPRILPGFSGCTFRDRCDHAIAQCNKVVPRRERPGGGAYLCHLGHLGQSAPKIVPAAVTS
jgi:oligopeptide/dipeptide ABC transporter ATP-binding protein